MTAYLMDTYRKFTALLATLAIAAPALAIDDGNRDHAFNSPLGFGHHHLSYDLNRPNDALVDDNQNVLMAGIASAGSLFTYGTLIRLQPNGEVDLAFGPAAHPGVVRLLVDGRSTEIKAITRDAYGRIVVAGNTYTTTMGVSAFVGRLESDGSLDATFGTGGFWIGRLYAFNDVIVDVDHGGRILAAGRVNTTTGRDMVVVGLQPSGSLDTTFGSGGVKQINFGSQPVIDSSYDDATELLLPEYGGIVVAGSSTESGTTIERIAIAHLDSDGALGTGGFGEGGKVRIGLDWCEGHDGIDSLETRAVVLTSVSGSYRFLIGAQGDEFSCDDRMASVVVALDSAGQLDTSYGNAGHTAARYFSDEPDPESLRDLIVDGDHILLVGSGQQTDGRTRLGVARLKSDGSRDPVFAGDGVGLYDLRQTGSTEGCAIALQHPYPGQEARPIAVGAWYPEPATSPSYANFIAVRLVSDRIFGHGYQNN